MIASYGSARRPSLAGRRNFRWALDLTFASLCYPKLQTARGITMSSLPYVTAPGNIEKALKGIQTAATPESVSQDFVKTILQIKGGSGNQITAYLKKIGFANADGTPSDIYKKFRNPSTAGKAAADALRYGYAPLFVRNEYMYKLSDEDLRGLVIEETGQGDDSNTVPLILAAIKALKKFAKWTPSETEGAQGTELVTQPVPPEAKQAASRSATLGLNLSYTINLNLPVTSDIAVFNAIFKSIRDNLLKGSDDKG
jgi:hypothetical protein